MKAAGQERITNCRHCYRQEHYYTCADCCHCGVDGTLEGAE